MEMTVGKRIRQARIKAGMTQIEVANAMGTTYQNISQYERGVRKPKMSTIHKLAAVLGCNAWNLYDGFSEGVDFDQTMDWAEIERFRDQMAQKQFNQEKNTLIDYPVKDKSIPLFCSDGTEALPKGEIVKTVVCLDTSIFSRCIYATRVCDDRMEPVLRIDDTVFISPDHWDDGTIVLICHNKKFMLRRIRHTQEGLILICDNATKYSPDVIPRAKVKEYNVIGKVIALSRCVK